MKAAQDFAGQVASSRQCHRQTGFDRLPPELRLKIWSCAVEPRVVILDDLAQQNESYPLPLVTRLNAEARAETRLDFEPVGRGSYFRFDQDIAVCDTSITDTGSQKPLEDLALRVQRLAFWDCFPDDGRVDSLSRYSTYLASCCPIELFGKIEFDKLWFPNLRELWVIKVGDVDKCWMVGADATVKPEIGFQQTARQFRYWVGNGTIEMAALDVSDADTKIVLREGRCGRTDCQELNKGRRKLVTKVIFVDEEYIEMAEDKAGRWKRIHPWPVYPEQVGVETNPTVTADRMRWIMVERILTFSLRWDNFDETTPKSRHRHRGEDMR